MALLARAAGQAPAGARGALTPGALLDLAVEVREDSPAVPVAATLLDELLPGLRPEEAAALTVLAAAHDEESARVLARTRLRAASADGDVVLRLRDALRADGWPAGTARPGGSGGTGAAPSHFVADPLLRALLLHRLRFHDGDAPAYAAWRAVHETLLAHCGPRPTPYRLRQELALGRAEGAVTALREWFGDPDAGGWLDRLLLVASAPYPRVPHRGAPDPRRAVALGQDPGPVGELAGLDGATTALHQSVRRLLHAVWLLTDPLALPDEDVVERMAHELRQLSGRHLTGSLPLWDAATHWPRDIRARRAPTSPPGNEDGA
ncbi:hypothetical protein [Streptomyces somaliensis]|uniref:hypothetical protein n=1 Tax=Streptomyces somaliensis TaxID=78355 RepID=UPI0034E95FA8|nr:hypothetical protein [Streptomyces somaliensis]